MTLPSVGNWHTQPDVQAMYKQVYLEHGVLNFSCSLEKLRDSQHFLHLSILIYRWSISEDLEREQVDNQM